MLCFEFDITNAIEVNIYMTLLHLLADILSIWKGSCINGTFFFSFLVDLSSIFLVTQFINDVYFIRSIKYAII